MRPGAGCVRLAGGLAPHDYSIGDGKVFTVGIGMLAYTFGLRHAFDADHIAAVDNTTRTLLEDDARRKAEGEPARPRPLSVGFWFSLGHSTIVFALSFLLALGIKALAGPVADARSTLHVVTEVIGASVSGVFLWILGLVNLTVLVGIVRVFRRMRSGRYDEAAAFSLPFYSILVLPILFAAGMCLMDTIDGVFMNAAYGWEFARPVRKVFYNLTITAISVAVALIIGTIELLGVIADGAHVDSGPLGWFAGLDLDYVGYVIVGFFVAAWAIALLIWRFGRIEERWSAPGAPSPPGD